DTGLLDPGSAGHLAIAVEREPASEDRLAPGAAPREDSSYTGADRSFSLHQSTRSPDQGGVSHLDPCYIGYGVVPSWHTVEGNAEIPSPRFRLSEKGEAGQTETRSEGR